MKYEPQYKEWCHFIREVNKIRQIEYKKKRAICRGGSLLINKWVGGVGSCVKFPRSQFKVDLLVMGGKPFGGAPIP